MKLYFLILLLLLLACTSDARQVDSSAVQVDTTNAAELMVLRAQLELMRTHSETLLDTVFWSLAVMFSAILVIAGFGWYTNYRMYARDKESLEKETKFQVESSLQSAKAELQSTVDENLTRLKKTLEESFSDRFKSMKQDIVELERQNRLKEVEVAMKENRFDSALFGLTLVLEMSFKTTMGYFDVSELLEMMGEALKKSDGIDADTASRVIKVLREVPESYVADVDNIRELVKEKRKSR